MVAFGSVHRDSMNSCLLDRPGNSGNSMVEFDCSLDRGSGSRVVSRECQKRCQLACL